MAVDATAIPIPVAMPIIQPHQSLTDAERLCRLRLARSESIGPILFSQLLAKCGSAADAIFALPSLARRGGRAKPLTICSEDQALQEVEALDRLGGRFIVSGEPGYPAVLAATDDAPPVLGVLGDPSLLVGRTIAIVGARNASANGKRFASQIARDLGRNHVVVVSGLARGIDAAAHEGALASGTVAVVAGGLDIVYPRENETLFDRIVEAGAAIAENPLGVVPTARHFPRRNRIISGLSLGVIVVEAAARSGSLITARLAGEQGRQVFAVPGSPLDPRSKGTNNLIRQGAVLVDSIDDVLELLDRNSPLPAPKGIIHAPSNGPPPEVEEPLPAPHHETILDAIGPTPTGVDDLIRHTGLPASVVATLLLELELAGKIDRYSGNKVARSV